MKGDPEQRAVQLGEYIAANRATVRAAAAVFGCSKSTVHKDVAVRLRTLQPELFRQVRAVLACNKAERHLRGGAAFADAIVLLGGDPSGQGVFPAQFCFVSEMRPLASSGALSIVRSSRSGPSASPT